jgi:hypothetical protein
MSVAASTWAWEQKTGSVTRKAVLMALADFADSRGTNCFPGHSMLARMTELTERSVRNALAELEVQGKIGHSSRQHRGRAGFVDGYRLLCDPDRLTYRRQAEAGSGSQAEAGSGSQAEAGSGSQAEAGSGSQAETGASQPERRSVQPETGSETEPFNYYTDPIRKDPSMDPSEKSAREAGAKASGRKSGNQQPEIPWLDSFELTPEMREFAVKHGVDADREFEAWRDDCAAHGRRYRDWPAAWRTRIRRVPDFSRTAAISARNPVSPGMANLMRIAAGKK